MSDITPFLWFDKDAETAATYYCSLFENSRISQVVRNDGGAQGSNGTVLTVAFELRGRPFIALNGGPHFKFNEAISFVIHCESQAEVDRYWESLSEGGQEGQCGWLKDRFGVSWQVVPKALVRFLSDSDRQRSTRVISEMMTMGKLDIAKLERAYHGEN